MVEGVALWPRLTVGGASTRRGPLPTQDSFTSPLHSTRTAALLGVALGVSFSVCCHGRGGVVAPAHLSWIPMAKLQPIDKSPNQ